MIAAAIGAGCTRTDIVMVGRYKPNPYGGNVAARVADAARALVVVGVTGPDSDATPTCKDWSYSIGAHAERIYAYPGGYRMSARVSRVGQPDFVISGRVAVEDGRCYLPAMTCEGPIQNARSCRLILERETCPTVWFPRMKYPDSHPTRRCEVPREGPRA